MRIPEKYTRQLRQAGLLVSFKRRGGEDDPDVRQIVKPVSAGGVSSPVRREFIWCGNLKPSEDVETHGQEIVTAMPSMVLIYNGKQWTVQVRTFIPGPGAGSFLNKHRTAEAAIADVLDYYFHSPERIAEWVAVRMED